MTMRERDQRPWAPTVFDAVVIAVVGTIIQAIYLRFGSISFECDALAFANNADFILGTGGPYLPYRGPGYSLFLIATGRGWVDSLYGTIAAQAAMGIAAPVLVYLTLRPLGRWVGIVAAAMLLASATSFSYALVILPQQLSMFLIVACVFFFSRYYFSDRPLYLYALAVTAVLAMLTRGEGLPLLLILGGFSALVSLVRRRNRAHVALACLCSLVLVFAHTNQRSQTLNDPSLTTSLSNWSGRQFFLQPYLLQGRHVERIRRTVLAEPANGEWSRHFVHPDNGAASRRFYEMIEAAYADPAAYAYLEALLDPENAGEAAGTGSADSVYHRLFGQFEGDHRALAMNVFTAPHMVYFDNIWPMLDRDMGMRASDAIFMDVAWEAVWANPEILIAFAQNAFWYLGIDLVSVLEGRAGPGDTIRQARYWASSDRPPPGSDETGGLVRNFVINAYFYPRFDVAGCASAGLSDEVFQDYARSYPEMGGGDGQATTILTALEFTGTLTMMVTGLGVVLGWWILLFSPRRLFWLSIGLSALATLAIISAGNTASAKYDPILQPMFAMIFAGVLSDVVGRLVGGRDRRGTDALKERT